MSEDDQHCRDGTLSGFGLRLAGRYASDQAMPGDLLALLAELDVPGVHARGADFRG